MEGTSIPPPVAPGPRIGESGKLRSALDLLKISKIISLIVGILGFLLSAWTGFDVIFGDMFSIPWVGYYVIMGIINLIIYTQIPEFEELVRSRRYGDAKDQMLIWAVLGIIFGFLTGLFLLLVIFMYLEDLDRENTGYSPPQY